MPTIIVSRRYFFSLFGQELSDKDLTDLCFEYGLEVEFPSESEAAEEEDDFGDAKEGVKEVKLKFEIGANRYDLLCVEGVAFALAVYKGLMPIPKYTIKNLANPREKLIVKPATAQIRPFVVGAILRNLKFTPDSYRSFIAFQTKLHHNIGRKRTLVSIGTHDLSTIKGPFTYDARPPKDIKFAPLNQHIEMDGEELMLFYQKDNKLKEFLPIIQNSPVFPVIVDNNNIVLSLPPIINGNHSKLTMDTKDVLIEITATDLTKAKMALNSIIGSFSFYCADKFSIEEVEVVYEADASKNYVTPEIATRGFEVEVNNVASFLGVPIDAKRCVELLKKMGVDSELKTDQKILAHVPMTRGDIMHACDVIEDIAVGYGFNNIPDILPPSATTGGQQIINKFNELLRGEMAAAGYTECLNFALNSKKELTTAMNKPLKEEELVTLANPKTHDFQAVRNSLIPGLLKSLEANKAQKLPIQLFEISDVCFVDEKHETGARNERHLAALQTHKDGSGFEFIHGLLDFLMAKLRVANNETGYTIKESADPSFFPGRQAQVLLKGKPIGIMGIIHPEVMKTFELKYPISMIELNIEPLVEHFFQVKHTH